MTGPTTDFKSKSINLNQINQSINDAVRSVNKIRVCVFKAPWTVYGRLTSAGTVAARFSTAYLLWAPVHYCLKPKPVGSAEDICWRPHEQ